MLVDPGIQSDKRVLPTLPTVPLGLLSDGVMSWKVSPPKFLCGCSHVTPGSQNVTSFSRRVFAEVVKLKQGRYLERALIQYDLCPYKKGKCGHTRTQKERWVKMKAELEGMHPEARNTRDASKVPEAGGRPGPDSPL